MTTHTPTMTQEDMDRLRVLYADKPLVFSRDILKITPDAQQAKLILEGCGYEARIAVKSCTGSGKTCGLGIIAIHQLFIHSDIKIIATSPSAGQLERGFRAEIAKLLGRIDIPDIREQFVLMSDKLYIKGAKELQFCAFVTGSAENKENLAGIHAGKVILMNDEASATQQEIFDTLLGNLTEPGSSIIQTSNPVRSSGPFKGLWDQPPEKSIWSLHTFTADKCPRISRSWITMIETEYGKDSDMYRMRVLGKFPRADSSAFIGGNLIEDAVRNSVKVEEYKHYPILVGADIARFGDDRTVFITRQGPKLLDITSYSGLDTMQVASELLLYSREKRADKVFIDGVGVGAGVVDRCNQLGMPVVDVVVSSKPSNPRTYYNLRSECWGSLRDWLVNGADIPNDKDLREQLEGMQYGYNNKMQIQLMSKKDIKSKLGLKSPDIPDCIALTFSEEIFKTNTAVFKARPVIRQRSVMWA